MKKLISLSLAIMALACSKEADRSSYVSEEVSISELETKSEENPAENVDIQYGAFVDYYADSTKQFVTLSNGLVVEKVGDLYILENDIVFSDSTLYVIEEMSMGGARSAASNAPVKYWPYRRVPYEFDSSFTSEYRNLALSAMASISSVSGVKFVPAESSHANRIRFCYSTVNNSYIGMTGGTQIINIVSKSAGTIIHEILHALGFFHEHSRADRDSYISIKTNNIKSDALHNFNKYSGGMDIGPFDFNSIMLYGSMTNDASFAINTSLPIITKLDGSTFNANRLSLSSGDIIGLKSIYGPPYHKLTVHEDVIEEYYDYETEIYNAEKTFMLKFYSNEACTTLTPLTHPRNILLRRYEQYCDANHQVHEGYRDITITVPAGVTQYEIETYEHYERYIQSIPYDVNTVRYVIINNH